MTRVQAGATCSFPNWQGRTATATVADLEPTRAWPRKHEVNNHIGAYAEPGEEIAIAGTIRMAVLAGSRRTVRLGITASASVRVLRGELLAEALRFPPRWL